MPAFCLCLWTFQRDCLIVWFLSLSIVLVLLSLDRLEESSALISHISKLRHKTGLNAYFDLKQLVALSYWVPFNHHWRRDNGNNSIKLILHVKQNRNLVFLLLSWNQNFKTSRCFWPANFLFTWLVFILDMFMENWTNIFDNLIGILSKTFLKMCWPWWGLKTISGFYFSLQLRECFVLQLSNYLWRVESLFLVLFWGGSLLFLTCSFCSFFTKHLFHNSLVPCFSLLAFILSSFILDDVVVLTQGLPVCFFY